MNTFRIYPSSPLLMAHRALLNRDAPIKGQKADASGEILLILATKTLAIYAAVYHTVLIGIKVIPAAIKEILHYQPLGTACMIGKSIPMSFGWSAVRWHAGRVAKAINILLISNAFDRAADKSLSARFVRRVDQLLPNMVMPLQRQRFTLYILFSMKQRPECVEPSAAQPVAVEPTQLENLNPTFGGSELAENVYEGISKRLGLDCPISQLAYVNPVVDANGHTGDLPEMQQWIKQQGSSARSPISQEPLRHHRLTPNLWVREAMEDIAAMAKTVAAEDQYSKEAQKTAVDASLAHLKFPAFVDPVVVHQPIPDFEVGETYERQDIPEEYRNVNYIVPNYLTKAVLETLADIKPKVAAASEAREDLSPPSFVAQESMHFSSGALSSNDEWELFGAAPDYQSV